MRKIKLAPDRPFHNNCDIAVLDMTDGKEQKRCKIMVDYVEYDIRQLQENGYDLQGTVGYFDDWIYQTVKRYIADDWECIEGHDEVMEIIKNHIKDYF